MNAAQQMLAAMRDRNAEAAKRNRENFPFASELMDVLAEFSPKLKDASQDGRSIGKPQDETGWVNVDEIIAMDDHNKRVKARQLKKDRR